MITVRTPFGNPESFQINNTSLDNNCAEGQGYIMGTVEIKTL